jgi:type II secretory ATPase GspE/PulE/Tfp pilus assembly ATPase PilB-like protein
MDPDGRVLLASAGPLEPTVSDELTRLFAAPIRLIELPAAEIQAAILSARQDTPNMNGAPPSIGDVDVEALDDLHALATQAPVIQLVNVMLLDAMRAGASDVHVESTVSGLRVRFRLDGVLHEVSALARQFRAAVISRIKLMAGLDVAERRLPQDGRARVRLADREVDLRVSTLPALHGESIVLRILGAGAIARELTELGMSADVEQRFDKLIRRASGIVLVTGPTGSGKTTTLYGALARVNRPGVKTVTVEDPVEYQIEGVTQIPVNRKAGLPFAAALRSILRHDPDVIMVGEMRDRETAEIGVQAALTGHLVCSTLHTNDAPGGVTRLVDMGIEPYLVAATVQGILAQRLVRVRCDRCGGPDSGGCAACSHTGYRGRTGIFQLLAMTEELRALVVAGAPEADLRAAARKQGRTLHEDGVAKVQAGVTTMEEVMRVTSEDAEA